MDTFLEQSAMTVHDRIQINPRVMLGKPVIKGSRITVELVLRKIAEGADERALLEAYPHLTKEDIQAAVRYAADAIAHEEAPLDAEIESAWENEIRARIRAVDEGRVVGRSHEQIKNDLADRFRLRESLSKFTPDGWRTVTAKIITHDVAGLACFLKTVFGGHGEVRVRAPTQIRIGDSIVMISVGEPRPSACVWTRITQRRVGMAAPNRSRNSYAQGTAARAHATRRTQQQRNRHPTAQEHPHSQNPTQRRLSQVRCPKPHPTIASTIVIDRRSPA
jgi:uncharacterized protein (DUF433 family)